MQRISRGLRPHSKNLTEDFPNEYSNDGANAPTWLLANCPEEATVEDVEDALREVLLSFSV